MEQKKNLYMGLNEMIVTLSGASYNDINRLKVLFDSIKHGGFYTAYGALMEKTEDANIRQLVKNIFDYYTVDKKGKFENLFFSNLKMLLGALYDNVAQDLQNLMLAIMSLNDEKVKYNMLKWVAKVIKNEGVKDKIYLSVLDNKYARLDDYNLYLSRWVDKNITKVMNFKEIISNWIIQIKRFVLIADYSEKDFDAMFQNINKILTKLATRDSQLVVNIRYICGIQPSSNYEQEHYKKLYSGVNDIVSPNLTRIIELSNEIKLQNRTIVNLQYENERLKKMLSETASVREKKLADEVRELTHEKEKLLKENEKLEQKLIHTNCYLDELRSTILNKPNSK